MGAAEGQLAPAGEGSLAGGGQVLLFTMNFGQFVLCLQLGMYCMLIIHCGILPTVQYVPPQPEKKLSK